MADMKRRKDNGNLFPVNPMPNVPPIKDERLGKDKFEVVPIPMRVGSGDWKRTEI